MKIYFKIYLCIVALLGILFVAHIVFVSNAYREILTAVPLWMQIALAVLIWGGLIAVATVVYVVLKKKSQ